MQVKNNSGLFRIHHQEILHQITQKRKKSKSRKETAKQNTKTKKETRK